MKYKLKTMEEYYLHIIISTSIVAICSVFRTYIMTKAKERRIDKLKEVPVPTIKAMAEYEKKTNFLERLNNKFKSKE